MEWVEVKCNKDIENLLNVFGYFHDGCLREVHLWNSYYIDEKLSASCGDCSLNAKVFFQRQAMNPSAIELLFEGVERVNIISSAPGYWYSIFEASLFYSDGHIYFADENDWNFDKLKNGEITWISAKTLKWRERSEWMGDRLRYDK